MNRPLWKEAATVLLIRKSATALNHPSVHKFNYKILMLERSSKSKFMPSAYVFPGGKISDIDFSNKWKNVLGNTMYDTPVIIASKERSPMLIAETKTHISNDVAFRLCGIRETFEETGILLQADTTVNKDALKKWRHKAKGDDAIFFNMCKEMKLVPNIGALHEWCNWLTPTNMSAMHSNKRFDTVFYISFLDQTDQATEIDDAEIVASKWYHPADLLQDYCNEKLWLAPPQLYDVHRFFNPGFGDFDTLKKFALNREVNGCERWMPVTMVCIDGVITVLPGDDMYPSTNEIDIEGKMPRVELSCSIEETRNKTVNLHRFEFFGLYNCKLQCNITLRCGHLKPNCDITL